MTRASYASLVAAPLLFLASACFDGGDYQGGGRRIEAPAMVDVASDGIDDATTTEDASPDDADAPRMEDGALTDASLDLPRSEPPPEVQDAGRGEAEAPPFDVTPLDVGADGPDGALDATNSSDAALDIPLRDAPTDPRRD
ncbi:MAG TPA: hypothetical protein VK540_10730 [Polyangiaceae bacterium]|nr:hypothetical protein [Polyangiaceae bacterium]